MREPEGSQGATGAQAAGTTLCYCYSVPYQVWKKSYKQNSRWERAYPSWGHHFHYQTSWFNVPNTKSHGDWESQKSVALLNKRPCQQSPLPCPGQGWGEPESHVNPTRRHQAGQLPPDAHPLFKAERWESCPNQLFKQKMLVQDFQV